MNKILVLLFIIYASSAIASDGTVRYVTLHRQLFQTLKKPVMHLSLATHSYSTAFNINNNQLPKRYYRFRNSGIGLLTTGGALMVVGITLIAEGLRPVADPYAIGPSVDMAAGIPVLCVSVLLFTLPGAAFLALAKKIKCKNVVFYPTISTNNFACIKPRSPVPGVSLSLKF